MRTLGAGSGFGGFGALSCAASGASKHRNAEDRSSKGPAHHDLPMKPLVIAGRGRPASVVATSAASSGATSAIVVNGRT